MVQAGPASAEWNWWPYRIRQRNNPANHSGHFVDLILFLPACEHALLIVSTGSTVSRLDAW